MVERQIQKYAVIADKPCSRSEKMYLLFGTLLALLTRSKTDCTIKADFENIFYGEAALGDAIQRNRGRWILLICNFGEIVEAVT